MDTLPDAIFREWVHSFEEDTPGVMVYRPADYDFPRARGRRGIEFRPDGEYIESPIGPADVPRPVSGSWQAEGNNLVSVSLGEESLAPARELEIVSVDDEKLVLRQPSA
jgi:hypothetical protein